MLIIYEVIVKRSPMSEGAGSIDASVLISEKCLNTIIIY